MTGVRGPEIGHSVGMRTLTALIVLIACGASATSISAGSSGKAYLRVVDRDPLTVQGRAFKSRERVRVVASVPESAQTMGSASEIGRKTVRATATGSFRVVFSEMSVDRCSSGACHVGRSSRQHGCPEGAPLADVHAVALVP